jgi:nucleoside 2-deoxyribosyltransferase
MKALLLVPHDASYTRVADTLQRSLREAGFEPVSLDELMSPGTLLSAIVADAIRDADLIVADVSRKNPNIMYDLGLAHGLGKATILLLDAELAGSMPFDLAAFQIVTYSPDNLTPLRARLSRFLAHQRSRKTEES